MSVYILYLHFLIRLCLFKKTPTKKKKIENAHFILLLLQILIKILFFLMRHKPALMIQILKPLGHCARKINKDFAFHHFGSAKTIMPSSL